MYESFFGLDSLPFKITPDDRIFYGGAQRQDVLDALIYTVERGEGLITIIGEVGTGKTTIARVLSKRLPAGVRIASIYMPNVQPLDMLYMIAQELAINLPVQQPKYVVLEALRDYLLKEHEAGQRILLLIDEAQSMPLETLEELRLLSNMQTDDFKLLQIMLFGQQELEQILALPSVRQVKDRIVYHLDLSPFSIEELSGYLEFRMRMVGYRGEKFFSDDVVVAIHQATKGFPRAVNKLADHVLMSAFAEQSKQVLLRHVTVPINAVSIQVRESYPKALAFIRSSLVVQVVLAISALLLLVLLFMLVFSSDNETSTASDPAFVDQAVEPAQSAHLNSDVSIHMSESLDEKHLVSNDHLASDAVNSIKPVETTVAAATQQDVTKPVTEARSNVKHYPLSYWQDNHRKTLQRIAALPDSAAYSLQLMSDPWRLRDEFSVVSRSVTDRLADNPIFFTDYILSDGRARIALLYGVYNSREQAQAALTALPEFAKSYTPVVVALKSVTKQMSLSHAVQIEP